MSNASHDQPIASSTEDRLDRAPFARLLRSAILATNDQGATVIALTGMWGTGKSSVATMVVELMSSKATVVRFEPWMVGSKEALAREFFTTLGRTALPKANTEAAKEKRSRFYKYGSKILGVVATGTSFIGTVVPGAGVASKAAESISGLMQTAAAGLEDQAKDLTLKEERDLIAEDLLTLRKPVVIVVDDIDRLDKDEVRTTFQLIKACADFPNIRYLLLFDREQVLHALQDSVNNPSAFLEKIVNQTFDLPEATTKQRSAVLDEALTDLHLHEDLARPDMDRLSMVFDQVLLPGLPTLRHVKRFVATVNSLLPGVIVDGFRNIDPADFLALEFLRQYVPSVYTVLRDEDAPNPGGRLARIIRSEDWAKKVKEKRDKAVEVLQEPMRSLANEAVKLLFSTDRSSAHAHATRRFNTGYWKPVYLGFSDARANIKEKDWHAFTTMLASNKSAEKWVQGLEDRELRDRWVTAISSRAEELNFKQRLRLLKILFQWGDSHTYEQGQFPSGEHYSWDEAMRFSATALLEGIRKAKDKLQLLRQAISESHTLLSPALVVGMEISRRQKDGMGHWSYDADLSEFVPLLAPEIARIVESGEIWHAPDPNEFYHAWHYFDEKLAKQWYDSLFDDQEQFAHYLNFIVGAHKDDKNRLGWEVSDRTVKACQSVKTSLLTDKGKWARQFLMDSAANGRRLPWEEEASTTND